MKKQKRQCKEHSSKLSRAEWAALSDDEIEAYASYLNRIVGNEPGLHSELVKARELLRQRGRRAAARPPVAAPKLDAGTEEWVRTLMPKIDETDSVVQAILKVVRNGQ